MNGESQVWPVVLVAASLVLLLMILSVTSTGTIEVAGAG